MDDKAGRRKGSALYGRRLGQARSYWRKVWRLAKEYKNTRFTGFLLLIVVALLFGIFSQLKPPTTSDTTPNGVTTIDYSTFLKQVTTGNVLAVTVRGNEINALLANPLNSKVSSKAKPTSQSVMTDYAAWSRYIGFGNTSLTNQATSNSTTIDASRAVYTLIPTNGDEQLFPLLMQKHVIVNTLPASQSATWLAMVWKFLPVVFLIIFLLIFLATRNGSRSMRSTDDRVTQMGKSRARRFERAREAGTSSSETKKSALTPKNVPNAKSTAARVSTEIPVTFADVAGIDEVRTEL